MTSLKMPRIVYHTASLLLTALERSPLDTINLASMNLILTQLEYNLSAFAGHRVKQLQTPPPLITEVDTYPTAQTPFLSPAAKAETLGGANSHHRDSDEHLVMDNSTKTTSTPSYLQRNPTAPSGGYAWNSEGLLGGGGVGGGGVRLVRDADRLCPGYGGQRYTPPFEQDYYNALSTTNNFANSSYASSDGATAFGGSRGSVFSTPFTQVPGEVRLVGSVSYDSQVLSKHARTLNANELRSFGSANGHVALRSTTPVVVEQKKSPTVEKSGDVSPVAKGSPTTSSTSPFSLVSGCGVV